MTRQQTNGVPYETYLQIGAEYFVTNNVDVTQGLFNGATGTLKMIEYGRVAGLPELKVPKIAWMDFHNPIFGREKRQQWRPYMEKKGICLEWTPIDRITVSITKWRTNLRIIRIQIPLVGANGMTINKAQGSTMIFVVVTITPGMEREFLYVACSRATSINGLYIVGDFVAPTPPGPDDPVSREMERLRNNPLKFRLRFFQDYGPEFEKLFFHNVQSFIKHQLDVRADHCAMSSTILAFVEPHLLETDNLQDIPGFTLRHRSNCSETRNSEGALIYSKAVDGNGVLALPYISAEKCSRGHCLFLRWKRPDIELIVVYKSPKFPSSEFQKKLRQELCSTSDKCLLLGDFNINFQDLSNSTKELLRRRKFLPLLDQHLPTTDYATHIDSCFSNFKDNEINAWIYESYYSYHKPLCVVWRR